MNAKAKHIFDTIPNDQDIRRQPLFGGHGPVWYRGYAQEPDSCEQLRRVLKSFGAKRMVSGHTPQKDAIGQMCGGQYLVIDIGISSAYYRGVGGIEFLEPTEPNGEWETWAVYEDRREKLKAIGQK